ncbi:hypothetical protein [Agrobacterium pusense]|uniref:hypothetical protein n=1 Tax=Agrobacterium pusense TaxID=648995 RepID=UPI000D1A106F|nr:hypothetical protein [Agrobacterium pusense]
MTDIDVNAQFVTIKVPDDVDMSKPIPLRIARNEEAPNLWATTDGRRVFNSEEWAAKSMEMDGQEYKARQLKRMEASRLVRAEVTENYDGWVTIDGDEDSYAQDVPELLEKRRDQLSWGGVADEDIPSQLPAWVFCCTESGFDFDLESQLESYLADEHHENARDFLVDEKELWDFWNSWVEKQKNLTSYFIDTKRIVVIDRERYEAELAEAKAFLEGEGQ